MALFRKKPVTVEAFQHFDDMGTHTVAIPRWVIGAINTGVIVPIHDATFIRTLEGDMLVSDGDWIIKGVAGELYPCKPDIFAQLYDPA